MHPKDPLATGGLQIGQPLDGRYRIEALIGTGGTGKVYRASSSASTARGKSA